MAHGRRTLWGVALVLALAIVVVSCTPKPAAEPEKPKVDPVILAAYPRDFRDIDPANIPGSPDYQIAMNVFNGLVRYKVDSTEVEPDLAERWDVSPDGTVYTFYLRKDVEFHHGYGKFTAHDVKYSFERVLDPATGSRYRTTMDVVKSVEVLGEYTVRITLKGPSAEFLGAVLAFRPGYIVNQKAVEELGDKFPFNPIGTGPFQFVSYTPKQELVLEANPKYFRGEPDVKRVVWQVVPEESVAALALMKGELNYMIVRDVENYHLLLQQPGIAFTATPTTGWWYYGLNMTRKPLDDVRVRRAIAHAVDRDTFVSTLLEGVGEPAYSVIPPGMLGHTSDVAKYPYNPERAKELLAEAGATGANLGELVYADSAYARLMGPALQQWLRDIGVQIEILQLETGAYTARRQAGDYWVHIDGTTRFDPDQFLTEHFHSASFPPGGNTSYYDAVDDLIEAQRLAINPAERARILVQIQKQIAEDVPMVLLFNPTYITAYRDYITGNALNTAHWMTKFEFLKFEPK